MRYKWIWPIFLFALGAVYADVPEWKELDILSSDSVWATSSLTEMLPGGEVIYGPQALFDERIGTPWVEGVEGAGEGESVLVLTQQIVEGITLTNGFASTQRLFLRNNRIRQFSLQLVAGLTAPGMVSETDYYRYFVKEKTLPHHFTVADSRAPQFVDLGEWEALQDDFYGEVMKAFAADYPDFYGMILTDLGILPEEGDGLMYRSLIRETYGFFGIRITIGNVYRGTRFDDTCLDELLLQLAEF